jgi:hypothetical protein
VENLIPRTLCATVKELLFLYILVITDVPFYYVVAVGAYC